jgi:hypothetical protein
VNPFFCTGQHPVQLPVDCTANAPVIVSTHIRKARHLRLQCSLHPVLRKWMPSFNFTHRVRIDHILELTRLLQVKIVACWMHFLLLFVDDLSSFGAWLKLCQQSNFTLCLHSCFCHINGRKMQLANLESLHGWCLAYVDCASLAVDCQLSYIFYVVIMDIDLSPQHKNSHGQSCWQIYPSRLDMKLVNDNFF